MDLTQKALVYTKQNDELSTPMIANVTSVIAYPRKYVVLSAE